MKRNSKIKLLHCNAVFLWSYNLKIENCAICRYHIMDPCVECQKIINDITNDCSITWGICGHAFHFHCISKWLETKPICPLDTLKWEFSKAPK